MAVNDLSEISFAGVTDQLQVFGRIVMTSPATISDMPMDGVLEKKYYKNGYE